MDRASVLIFAAALAALALGCVPPGPRGPVTYVRAPYLESVTDRTAVLVWETREPLTATVVVGGTTHRIKEARTRHRLVLEGLEPGTVGHYVVNATRRGAFRTLPAAGAVVKAAVYGATADDPAGHRAAVALIRPADVDLALHTGRLIPPGADDATWETAVAGPLGDLLAGIGFYPVPPAGGTEKTRYDALFRLPGEGRWYSLDAGAAHFVFLDGAVRDSVMETQQAWLAADLAATDRPWKIAVLQATPFGAEAGTPALDEHVVRNLLPLCFEHGVTLLLSGSGKGYFRTKPLTDDQGRMLVSVNVAGVGAAAGRFAPREFVASATRLGQVLFLTMAPAAITGRAVGLDGTELDAFEINLADLAQYAAKGVAVRELVTALRLEEGIPVTATVEGPVMPNAMLKGRVTIGRFPYPGVAAVITWDREKTTWHVKPMNVIAAVSTTAEITVDFAMDYWGDAYPALKPAVSLRYNGRDYPVPVDLRLPSFREINILEMGQFPVVDGAVTEAEIAGLQEQTGLIRAGANEEARAGTRFYCGVFAQSLYVAVINLEPEMAKMTVTARERDGAVRQDDCDEVHIVPPDGSRPLIFAVNAAGQRYDALGEDDTWNANWQAAARREGDRWTAEFLIPLNVLGRDLAPGEDLAVRFNLCRNNAVSGEYSQWSRTYATPPMPEELGRAIILRK